MVPNHIIVYLLELSVQIMNEKHLFDANFANRLVSKQFPNFANFLIQPLASGGTDNAVFRLGNELAIRIPVASYAGGQLQKEIDLLPRFSHLPLPVPEIVGVGELSALLNDKWYIYRWIEGEDVTKQPLVDLHLQATSLAVFILELRNVSPLPKYASGEHNHSRGVALAELDQPTRTAISTVSDEFESNVLQVLWNDALSAQPHSAPAAWLHGDLHAGNMLADANGNLAAIIDFGLAGVGDPAIDLMPAWWVFDRESRDVFKRALNAGQAEWARGRGWALSVALNAYSYYRGSDKTQLTKMSREAIVRLLSDAD